MTDGGAAWRHRAGIVARLIAALCGGYAVAALLAIACAWSLPLARIDAVAFGTIAGLLAVPIAVMACFSARTAWRAWAAMLVCAILLAIIALSGGWRP